MTLGIEAVSLVFSAFIHVSLGIAAILKNHRSRLCVAFGFFCLLLFIQDGASLIGLLGFRSQSYFNPLLLAVTLPTLLIFQQELLPQFKVGLKRISLALFLTPMVALCLLSSLGMGSREVEAYLFGLSQALILIAGLCWTFAFYRAETQGVLSREKLRNRLAWKLGGLSAIFIGTDFLHHFFANFPPLGTVARTFYVLFLFQTFIQKELITPREVFAKGALFGGVALIFTFIYSLLVVWVGDRPALFFFNTLVASFVIMVLYDPIRRLTERFTRKVFLGRSDEWVQTLEKLSADILGVVDPGLIAQKLNETLIKTLGARESSFYIQAPDGFGFVSEGGKGFGSGHMASNLLVEYMRLRKGRPFVFENLLIDRDSFYSSQGRKFCEGCMDEMRSLRLDLVIPFVKRTALLGFCLVRTGNDRIVLSNEQLRLFGRAAREIAMVLENIRYFERAQSEERMVSLGEMALGLAHEIKNPLGAIKGAAELLKDNHSLSPIDRNEFVNIIAQETDRLSRVVGDFLDYARPRSSEVREHCDVLKVIEHTVALVLRESKVRSEVVIETKSTLVKVDAEILKQVLVNILLNAVQALKETPQPEIVVRLREESARPRVELPGKMPVFKILEGWDPQLDLSRARKLCIDVMDNGPGIAEKVLDHIFMPFFTTKAKGTGLGLAICRRLVEGMGGSIHYQARAASGAIFSIHIPNLVEPERVLT